MDEPPIACTLDGNEMGDRVDEFGALFAASLIDKERTADAIRFRFAASAGVEEQVRDLARREAACCSFFTFTITAAPDAIVWETTVSNPDASAVLDEFFALPELLASRPG